ncbi:MAG: AMP-binding protein, partial [bacterium]|nr:AMP-binding protein [bacterium]
IEMIIGLLGILKVGAAYLPIEPGYPKERIDYMLKDSNAGALITDLKEFGPLGEGIERIDIHALYETFPSTENQAPASGVQHTAADLAYIIYTSGSTGKPKGVLIEHHGVSRLVKNAGYIDFSREDRLLLTGAIVFDVTTFEIWGPQLNGACLYLPHKNDILDAEKLETIIVKNKITIL